MRLPTSTRLSRRIRAAYVGVAALDTALSASRQPLAHRARYLTKPLLMPLLAGSVRAAPSSGGARRAVLAAEAAGWVGDVALLSENRRPFAVGTVGFGVGHLAYLAAFLPRGRQEPRLVADPRARVVAALWATTGPVVAWHARRDGLAPVIAAYSATLASMAVAATRLDPSVDPTARRLVAAGGLTFLASDALLGLRKFVLDDPDPRLEGAVMATYTVAQMLLGEGASRL